MEIIWTEFDYHLSHWQTVRIPLKEKRGHFWNSRKTIRSWVGKHNKDIDPPSLVGTITKDNKTLLAELFVLPRGKFNLLLGSNNSHGACYESALVFHEKDFGLTKSRPADIKKAIKKHLKDIEAEVDKRLNGEWKYQSDKEIEDLMRFVGGDIKRGI